MPVENNENYENHTIPYENQQKNKKYIVYIKNHSNYENRIVP